MRQPQAKYTAQKEERVCRIDLNEGEIEVDGIEREKCKRLLKSLLEE